MLINTSSDRFLWFSCIKENFGLEYYLNTLNVKKFRDTFIRFRMGINKLRSNDRYREVVDAKCPFCQGVENEEHVLLSCPVYQQLREKYLQRYIGNKGSLNACKHLMKGIHGKMTQSVAMFVYYALLYREQRLNE